MEGFLPTLIVVLVIAAVVAAYIWYLKKSGYLDDFDSPDESVAESDRFNVHYTSQEKKAAQLRDRYSRS
jgi:Tfp pilus assembly protein PilO